MIELTKGEAESLCDFIEMNLIESIRNDPYCDNLVYVENLLRVWRKCGGRRVDDEKEASMAILIPDMKMPESCNVCPCETDNVCCVAVTHLTYHEWAESRPSWCPLREVHLPTRNADMDKLMQEAGWE